MSIKSYTNYTNWAWLIRCRAKQIVHNTSLFLPRLSLPIGAAEAVISEQSIHTLGGVMMCLLTSSLFPGFNSNINLPGRDDQGPTCLSPQLQDKNANTHNHHSPNTPSPAPVENGNQLSNGNPRRLI